MKNKQKGFTLIELLIVVAIIGILAAVGAVVIPNVLGGAKEKTATSNHKAISDWVQVQFTQCSLGEANLTYTSNASVELQLWLVQQMQQVIMMLLLII